MQLRLNAKAKQKCIAKNEQIKFKITEQLKHKTVTNFAFVAGL